MRAWHWLLLGAVVLAAAGGVAMWAIPAAGRKYAPLFALNEQRFGLPTNLLARIAQQESSFLPAIITGERVSAAGAVGMMQIVPRWHPGITLEDIKNPERAVPYAANYLAQLRRQFGNWRDAIAAYNWGPGNVSKWVKAGRDPNRLPEETRNYVRGVAGDLGLT